MANNSDATDLEKKKNHGKEFHWSEPDSTESQIVQKYQFYLIGLQVRQKFVFWQVYQQCAGYCCFPNQTKSYLLEMAMLRINCPIF